MSINPAIETTMRSAGADRRAPASPQLSLVVPTYNEAENLPILLTQLAEVLSEVDYEIIVVDDDSPDGTWRVAEELAEHSHRIRTIRRIGERGLSSAVMTGMSMAKGDAIAVMDADLQHDAAALPLMLAQVAEAGVDVVVASREVEGGSYGSFAPSRRRLSTLGATLARSLTGTAVTDPMSGFFMISRAHHDRVAPKANPRGFKILLEFLVRGPRPRVAEVGYAFGERRHGETKLTTSVAFSYLVSLASLVTGRIISATMTAYLLIGLLGVAIRYGLLGLGAAFEPSLGFGISPLLAFEASVVANYWLNNRFTFTAEQRRGRRLITGLVPFHLVALHGLVVQAGVVAVGSSGSFRLAEGPVVLQFAGILLATTGNYVLNRTFTWRPATAASYAP